MSLKNSFLAACVVLMGAAGTAQAGVYHVDVYTGDIGHSFDAVTGSASLFTSAAHSQHATFTYTGALQFVNTAAQNTSTAGDVNAAFFGANVSGISDYAAVTTTSADYGSFATLSSYLTASGSISGYGYGSLYLITDETGTATKGTNLTIRHDDGIGVYEGGVLLPGTTTGPTSAITETITLPAGNGYTLAYGRENGTPSVLTVAVPEPMTLSLLGAGAFGLALVRRRRS